jgi:hypothetical protein
VGNPCIDYAISPYSQKSELASPAAAVALSVYFACGLIAKESFLVINQ